MCFSAAGSFAIAGLLTGAGAASMARNSSAPHRMFAAIPFIFAAQQAAEGTVWLTMDGTHSMLHRLAASAFLAFALVVWPMWLPFSLRLVERNHARRRVLTAMFLFGCCVSLYAALLLSRWAPIARIAGHSIRYDYAGSGDSSQRFYFLAYLVPTILPFFVSTTHLARTLGTVMVGSLAVTVLVERDTLTSVWCFFAAILSGLIFVAVVREQRSSQTAQQPVAGR